MKGAANIVTNKVYVANSNQNQPTVGIVTVIDGGNNATPIATAGEPFAINKGSGRIEVTISIGLSTLETKGEPVADVLKRADVALYRAKHDGRNRVVATAA